MVAVSIRYRNPLDYKRKAHKITVYWFMIDDPWNRGDTSSRDDDERGHVDILDYAFHSLSKSIDEAKSVTGCPIVISKNSLSLPRVVTNDAKFHRGEEEVYFHLERWIEHWGLITQ